MKPIDFDLLLAACTSGGGSCLVSTTDLRPAGGWHTSVAPAKFAPAKGQGAVYAYETRFLDGKPRRAVIIDSKQSQLNRIEAAIHLAIEQEDPVLGRLPRIEVVYGNQGGAERYTDLTLPHRAFDGHIRAGRIDGQGVTSHPPYIALRDASPANARALLVTSPVTLVFGGWDASRKTRQGRWRSALVGEIVGFCAEGGPDRRGGARVDPVGMQMQVGPDTALELVKRQQEELSPKLYQKILKEVEAAKKKRANISLSHLGLGGIPPALNQLAGVACDRIKRTHVLSFATLRQMRFGCETPEGDAACRGLLAALALDGLARSDHELCLRANCDLVEDGPTRVTIDRRRGKEEEVSPLAIEATAKLLGQALDHAATAAKIEWSGTILRVEGDPDILAGAVADAEEEEGGE